MEKLTKLQIKKANILLEILCESKYLDNNKLYSFFDDKDEAQYVCKTLEENDLLKAVWLSENNIASINKTDNTCNAVINRVLDKELKFKRKITFTSNLTIISLIVSVILNILLTGNQFHILNDSSALKDSLVTCNVRNTNLSHYLDSVNVKYQKLQDQVEAPMMIGEQY